jgi:hypothetical protein
MTDIKQVRVAWTGAIGMPGVSTFYCTGDVATFRTALTAFFTADKSLYPSIVTITVPNTGSVIDSDSGLVTGTWTSGTSTSIACTGTGNFSAATGMVVNWHTGIYVGGRELRGKTFLVPMVVSTLSADGTPNATDRAGVQSDANTLAGTTASMVVYSRRANTIASVSSATVPDIAAVLRSRRD